MASVQPFSVGSPTINVTGTSSALTGAAMPGVTGAGTCVQFVNEGPNTVFVALGATAAVAAQLPSGTPSTTSMPILAGEIAIYSRNPNTDLFISTICRATQTAVLNVSVGEGQ